tara:strand:+ start:1166 stop:1342 length:177 start_codon:yes stop_codon:yes gene_type:complete
MPKGEKAFQTTTELKMMYDRSLHPVELLTNQPFKRKRTYDELPMTKTTLMMKGRGGSI